MQPLCNISDVWQAGRPSANVNAEPLYVKRKAVVTGSEEPPAVTTSEEMSTEQDDQADVPAGIPEFWLNVLRANTITQAKVSTCHSNLSQVLVAPSASQQQKLWAK